MMGPTLFLHPHRYLVSWISHIVGAWWLEFEVLIAAFALVQELVDGLAVVEVEWMSSERVK